MECGCEPLLRKLMRTRSPSLARKRRARDPAVVGPGREEDARRDLDLLVLANDLEGSQRAAVRQRRHDPGGPSRSGCARVEPVAGVVDVADGSSPAVRAADRRATPGCAAPWADAARGPRRVGARAPPERSAGPLAVASAPPGEHSAPAKIVPESSASIWSFPLPLVEVKCYCKLFAI